MGLGLELGIRDVDADGTALPTTLVVWVGVSRAATLYRIQPVLPLHS